MVENKIDKGSDETIESTAQPNGGLNRRTRRDLIHAKELIKRAAGAHPGTRVALKKTEQILDEDANEIVLLTGDLNGYNEAQNLSKTQFILAKTWFNTGVSEEVLRRYFIPGYDRSAAYTQMILEANPSKLKQNKTMLSHLTEILNRKKVIFIDEEEREIVKNMDREGLPLKEMFKEIIRSRGESIELIKMQIDYLKEQDAKKKKAEEDERKLEQMVQDEERIRQEELTVRGEIPIERAIDAISEQTVEETFPLSGWNISWTSRYWSDNPNHLERIDTTGREAALVAIEDKAGHEISVGVKSVLRALEFHLLDRDKIQRALATRNKYAPEAIRRWVKVKRGKDRIGILIDEEKPNSAIFFVGGRDIVYRGL